MRPMTNSWQTLLCALTRSLTSGDFLYSLINSRFIFLRRGLLWYDLCLAAYFLLSSFRQALHHEPCWGYLCLDLHLVHKSSTVSMVTWPIRSPWLLDACRRSRMN